MSGIQFTALIRIPFSRGEYVDPQQATWDAAKDRTLWKMISKSSKASDLNWTELADSFHVPPKFLLQQAAWLYERHLDHVRTQMRKVGSSTTPAMFNLENTQTTIGGVSMKRGGSGGSGGYRAPLAVSMRQKDIPMSHDEAGAPAPSLSRTPSTNTITQARAQAQQPSSRNQPLRQQRNVVLDRTGQSSPTLFVPDGGRSSFDEGSPVEPASSSSSSSPSASDHENLVNRSQLYKRPPRFRVQRPRELTAYDEAIDEGEEPNNAPNTSLPFAKAHGANDARSTIQIPSRPLKSEATGMSKEKDYRNIDSTPDSSSKIEASSSATSSISDAPRLDLGIHSPRSPKRGNEPAKPSPRKVALKAMKDGSEGTPSMGSSFSDLDDASISQSALEEALLSNIQHGRMSTLSQLRSRYL